jgi:hypothetical protein
VLAIVASFVFWHSGGRAAALCLRERFVSSGSLSAWPPGARCTFGEPELHSTLVNPWFVGTIFVLAPLAFLGAEWLSRRVIAPRAASHR